MQPYTESFYTSLDDSSTRSAKEVVPLVMKLLQPKRVIDVGCGLGNWLLVFKEHGVEDILGIDGDHVDVKMLKIPQECFLTHDLGKPLNLEQVFDLVVSLEVAEHLPSESAEQFVDTLVSLGPAILFSAAIPYQPGNSHLNGQWPDYWISFFHQRGYQVFDCLRIKIWQNDNVAWWYSQNMFLFAKKSCLNNYPLLEQKFDNDNSTPLSIVHPKLYLLQQTICQDLQESWEPNKILSDKICLLLKFLLLKIIKNILSIF